MTDTYKLLAREIIIVTLKDYRRGDQPTREAVRRFVTEDSVTLVFCSKVYQLEPDALRADLLRRLQKIEEQINKP